VDRFTQLLYTSKADEYMALKLLTDRGMTIRDAILETIKKEQDQLTNWEDQDKDRKKKVNYGVA